MTTQKREGIKEGQRVGWTWPPLRREEGGVPAGASTQQATEILDKEPLGSQLFPDFLAPPPPLLKILYGPHFTWDKSPSPPHGP